MAFFGAVQTGCVLRDAILLGAMLKPIDCISYDLKRKGHHIPHDSQGQQPVIFPLVHIKEYWLRVDGNSKYASVITLLDIPDAIPSDKSVISYKNGDRIRSYDWRRI